MRRRSFSFKVEGDTDLDKGGSREETEARISDQELRRITRQGGLERSEKITRKELRRSRIQMKTTREEGMEEEMELPNIMVEDISREAGDWAELPVDVRSPQ